MALYEFSKSNIIKIYDKNTNETIEIFSTDLVQMDTQVFGWRVKMQPYFDKRLEFLMRGGTLAKLRIRDMISKNDYTLIGAKLIDIEIATNNIDQTVISIQCNKCIDYMQEYHKAFYEEYKKQYDKKHPIETMIKKIINIFK